MRTLNKIIKELKLNNEISDYRVIETRNTSIEEFYDLEKLETTRSIDTLEYRVTVYKEYLVDDKKMLGEASFNLGSEVSKNELKSQIAEAIKLTSLAMNPYYELVSGTTKSYKEKEISANPFEELEKIAKTFFNESDEVTRFNSFELFYTSNEVRLVNSKSVDYKSKSSNIMVEAIPTYRSETINTELYRTYNYQKIDYKKITEDAKNAIKEVKVRALAEPLKEAKKINVILKEEKILSMIEELISTYGYQSVYNHSNVKSIGESIQENPIAPLTISLTKDSKGSFFDMDGVILNETKIIENGIVKNYFGSNRFAYYLNQEPTGLLSKVKVEEGNKKYKEMKKAPHIEIVDLSGLQVDLLADYIGGEVRLGLLSDGKNEYPLSGFSFSGSLKDAINNLEISKEKCDIKGYEGAKYILLKDMSII